MSYYHRENIKTLYFRALANELLLCSDALLQLVCNGPTYKINPSIFTYFDIHINRMYRTNGSVKSNPLQLCVFVWLYFSQSYEKKSAFDVLSVSASHIWSRIAGASHSFANIFRDTLRKLGVQSYLCVKRTSGEKHQVYPWHYSTSLKC